MANSYTALIEEKPDVTLREFTLRCARASSVFVMQRDDSITDPPTEKHEPNPYYRDHMEQEQADLFGMEQLTDAQWADRRGEAYRSSVDGRLQSIADLNMLTGRYSRVEAQVEAWEVPSPDHEPLKKFMLEQVRYEIKSNREMLEYYASEPVLVSVADYKTSQIQMIKDSIRYCAQKWREEQERTVYRQQYTDLLYASLPSA